MVKFDGKPSFSASRRVLTVAYVVNLTRCEFRHFGSATRCKYLLAHIVSRIDRLWFWRGHERLEYRFGCGSGVDREQSSVVCQREVGGSASGIELHGVSLRLVSHTVWHHAAVYHTMAYGSILSNVFLSKVSFGILAKFARSVSRLFYFHRHAYCGFGQIVHGAFSRNSRFVVAYLSLAESCGGSQKHT